MKAPGYIATIPLLIALAATYCRSGGGAAAVIELSESPRSWLFPDFANQDEVSHILSQVKSLEFGLCEAQRVQNNGKACAVLPVAADSMLRFEGGLIRRIGEVWAVDTSGFTSLAVVRYAPGSPDSHVHVDHYSDGTPADITLLLYLTDMTGDGSGNTSFPFAKPAPFSVSPRRGTLLAWMNVDRKGVEEPAARHYVEAWSRQAEYPRMILQFSLTLRRQRVPSCPPQPIKYESWPYDIEYNPLLNSTGHRAACAIHGGDDKIFPSEKNPHGPQEFTKGEPCEFVDDCGHLTCGCSCPDGWTTKSECFSCKCGPYSPKNSLTIHRRLGGSRHRRLGGH